MPTTLSILMPVYNERETLERAVDDALSAELPVEARQLVIVDDGSTDGTREILRDGIPPDRPALVTSDFVQSIYIAFALDGRCKAELGYLPYRALTKLTDTDTCFYPSPLSLQEDGRDALDP